MKQCPTCGQPSPDDAMYCARCGASLNQAGQAAPQRLPVESAGFGRRLLALIIDTVVLGLVYWNVWIFIVLVPRPRNPLTSVASALAVGFAASMVYFAWLYSTTGQTIGKRLLGIKVVSLDGARLNWGQGIWRTAGYVLSHVTGLGFLWAIWDPYRQTWHDKIAGTVVVRSWVAPEPLEGVIQPSEVRRQQKQWRWGLGIATFLTLLSISMCVSFIGLLAKASQSVDYARRYPSASVKVTECTLPPAEPAQGTSQVLQLYHHHWVAPVPDAIDAYSFFLEIRPDLVEEGRELLIPGEGVQPLLFYVRAPQCVYSTTVKGRFVILRAEDTALEA